MQKSKSIRIKIILFQCTWTEIKCNNYCLDLLAGLYCWAGPMAFSTTRQQELTRPTLLDFFGPIQSTTLERVLQHTANHDFVNKRKKFNSSPTQKNYIAFQRCSPLKIQSVTEETAQNAALCLNRSRFLLNSFL